MHDMDPTSLISIASKPNAVVLFWCYIKEYETNKIKVDSWSSKTQGKNYHYVNYFISLKRIGSKIFFKADNFLSNKPFGWKTMLFFGLCG